MSDYMIWNKKYYQENKKKYLFKEKNIMKIIKKH